MSKPCILDGIEITRREALERRRSQMISKVLIRRLRIKDIQVEFSSIRKKKEVATSKLLEINYSLC